MLIIILAAGKGTRMKSDLPKVLHSVADKPMLGYSIELAKKLKPKKIVVIVGSGAEKVKEVFSNADIEFCEQAEQIGTANAVLAAEAFIKKCKGNVLIMCGDMPNIKYETIKKFIDEADTAIPTVVSVKSSSPKGYGRVVRAIDKSLLKIVEEKDANDNEKKIDEINTGVYYCEAKELLKRLSNITNDNAQHEYYLTDIMFAGGKVWLAENENEFLGINDRVQLSECSREIWRKRAIEFMKEGVSIINPDDVYIGDSVSIASDVTIYPNVFLRGNTSIAGGCTIYHGVRIENSSIAQNTEIRENTLIESSKVGANCTIGPMAHLRPEAELAGNNNVGNFVELKKTSVGKNSKVPHFIYLGDASVGSGTNIGCGTITCNYDGYNKHKTVIGDNVLVGSDTQFVAPVTVGDGAIIGAGTTVTKNIPPNALTVARVPQENFEEKAIKIHKLNKQK